MHGITNECTHVGGTAAAINDHKTAHKHSSLALF